MTATFVDVADLGVAYSTTLDRRAALQAAISGATKMLVISGPVGVKRAGAGPGITTAGLTGKRILFAAGGYLFPIADGGSPNLPPDWLFDLVGTGNVLDHAFLWNKDDLGTPVPVLGSPEYPFDGLRVGGVDNEAIRPKVLHFHTGLRNWYGTGSRIIDAILTAKDKGQDINSNIAWANDALLNTGTVNSRVIRPICAVSTGAAAQTVTLDQPSLSGNHHRCGIGCDNFNTDLVIDSPTIGDGFVDSLHTEGGGNITVLAPTVGKGRRNAMTLAAATKVMGGVGKGIFGTDLNALEGVNGYIAGVTTDTSVKDFTLVGDQPGQNGVTLLAGAENVELEIAFQGQFNYLIKGVAKSVTFASTLRGSAKGIASVDRFGVDTGIFDLSGRYEGIRGDVGVIGYIGSGMLPKVHDLQITLLDGYTLASSPFQFGGSWVGQAPERRPSYDKVEIRWGGTGTAPSGAGALVNGGPDRWVTGQIMNCAWPAAMWAKAATGAWVDAAHWYAANNTSNVVS